MAKPRKKSAVPTQSNSNIPAKNRVGILLSGTGAIIAVLVFWWLQSSRETVSPNRTYFASVEDKLNEEQKWATVPCAKIEKSRRVKGCTPKKCGRFIVDDLIPDSDIKDLTAMAHKWMALGGASGGVTILDLHSGALSYQDKFIDAYEQAKSSAESPYNETDFVVYKRVKRIISQTIKNNLHFAIRSELYSASPTFFSKITSKRAVTEHDEYWHDHVDKITYGSFTYTCLLYLSNFGTDFTGGEFVFLDSGKNGDKEIAVQPRVGRLSCFTSGEENTHHITQVRSGERLALTVAFTCDEEHQIPDPNGIRASVAS